MKKTYEAWSVWLDCIRWISAFLVLYAHASGRLFADSQPALSAPYKTLFLLEKFVNGFSHQAVMVFFVMSGFLVGGSVISEYRRTQGIHLQSYMLRRLVRLWIVLLPVFAIGVLVDSIGWRIAGGPVEGVYFTDLPDRMTAGVVACNALFLQTFACNQTGSNGALWSLANEFWYYILFPLALLAVLPSRHGRAVRFAAGAAFAVLAVVLTAIQFDGWSLLPYMAIWLFGAYAFYQDKPVGNFGPRVSLAMFLLFIVGIRLGVRSEVFEAYPLMRYAVDLCTGALFANFVMAIRSAPSGFTLPFPRLHVLLASFSFSLYAVHVPLLGIMIVAGGRIGLPTSDALASSPATWLVFALLLIVPILAALALAWATEWRTDWVRKWITRVVFHRLGNAVGPEAAEPAVEAEREIHPELSDPVQAGAREVRHV